MLVWDLVSGKELCVFSRFDDYPLGSAAVSADGKIVCCRGARRINLDLPEQYRKLGPDPAPVAQAAWYAEWGVWAWTRELLLRERLAGHEVPALLLARSDWMCGDTDGAREAFDLAVARHETPAWYATLCMSVGNDPLVIHFTQPATRPSDPVESHPLSLPLAGSVLSAGDVKDLIPLIGKEVTVEGIVAESVWSKNAKHLDIVFQGDTEDTPGLVCVLHRENRAAFDAAFDSDARTAFSGARLRVHGTLIPYTGKRAELKGWPQIDLEDVKQVTIVK